MESLKTAGRISKGLTLTSDDFIESHASRLLLLVLLCGSKDRATSTQKIEGLTKLAKLDFFVRYPAFFQRAAQALGHDTVATENSNSDSKMIRFHYGPWDKRYYQVIPYLEAKGLLTVTKKGSAYNFTLTELGTRIARQLSEGTGFESLVAKMAKVKEVMSPLKGNQLKELIYKLFEQEVANKKLNDII